MVEQESEKSGFYQFKAVIEKSNWPKHKQGQGLIEKDLQQQVDMV